MLPVLFLHSQSARASFEWRLKGTVSTKLGEHMLSFSPISKVIEREGKCKFLLNERYCKSRNKPQTSPIHVTHFWHAWACLGSNEKVEKNNYDDK